MIRGPTPGAGSRRRAVARQSIERTSSPRTYSRSESNSVPWPRIISAVRPSSSRQPGEPGGEVPAGPGTAGSTRIRPADRRLDCRAASPSGPAERTVTKAVRRSPRRVGESVIRTARRSPGGMVTLLRAAGPPAEGCQASRTSARTVRRPPLVSDTVETTVSPSLTRAGRSRCTASARGDPARSRSTPTSAATSRIQPTSAPTPGPPSTSTSTIGTTPTASRRTARPERVMVVPRSDRHLHLLQDAAQDRVDRDPPRARPPDVAACGAARWAGAPPARDPG